MDEGYRTFEHTGDLGLEVWARGPCRLFALAAEALMAQIVDARGAAPDLVRELSLAGDDASDLLVHWLNTVLLESELSRAVWTRAEVDAWSDRSLRATLRGVRRDSARHAFLREVKAVSYHALDLDLSGPVCRCRVVLDI